MPSTLRRSLASLLVLGAVVGPPVVATLACGGQAPPPVTPAPTAASEAPAAVAPAPVEPVATASASVAPPPPVPVPTSAVATTKIEAAWAPCHQAFKPGMKDTSKGVAAMALACKGRTAFKPVGKTLTGKQADQDPPQSFPFEAKAKHCYRVYAAASEGIKDLDLVVKDSAQVIVAQDSTDDSTPVVLEDGAVCFSKDDKATVVVSIGLGKGDYAVQIWSD